MRKTFQIFLLLFTLCIFSLPLQASELDQKWSHWMMYYYFHQDVASVPDFLDAFDSSGILTEKKGNVEAPLAGSLSQIFAQNRDKLPIWLKDDYSPEMKDIIAVALLLEKLEKFAPKSYAEQIGKFSKIDTISTLIPVKPSDLDLMWGAFFASENPVFIRKIISVLDEEKSPTGDKTRDILVRGAAQWSLGSNMQQHVIVERAVRNERKKATVSVKKALDEIWNKFEEGKKGLQFKKHHGDFSAELNIVDPSVMEELKKPSYEGLHVKTVKTAHRGDDASFHLIFSGMDLSDTLYADVTFSLKALYPDGSVYYEDKDLEAFKGRTPKRFSVFTSGIIAGVHFEDDDPYGTYKIEATITDNISGKSLNLSNTVELVE